MVSNTRTGPVLPIISNGCPLNNAHVTFTNAIVTIHSIGPCKIYLRCEYRMRYRKMFFTGIRVTYDHRYASFVPLS